MRIPEVPLIPTPETLEAEAVVGFKWAGSPIGRRHRIGGEPDWIQEDEPQTCTCGKSMTFYAQLDSLGDNVCLADCGMIYVFICLDCFETKSVFQSH